MAEPAAQQPLATIAAAESALVRGEYQRGYTLAYDATMQAISVAAGRPLSHREAWRYVLNRDGLPESPTHWSDPALSDRPPSCLPRFSAYFSVAEIFKDCAGIATDAGPPGPVYDWDDAESLYFFAPVKALVKMLVDPTEAGQP